MNILAIDTSTLETSVAVVAGTAGAPRVLAASDSQARDHSSSVLQLVERMLATASLALADLGGLAIGAGPGSFTGLRIGMSTAKGLAFATGKPLWAVSSLAALALDVDRVDGRLDGLDPGAIVVPLLDARRGEVFAGFYRVAEGTAQALAAERVLAPEALADAIAEVVRAERATRVWALGDGLDAYGDVLATALRGQVERVPGGRATPSAVAVARLAMSGGVPDVAATGAPVYIRPSEAEIKFPDGNPGGTFSRSA
ncbi:MAG TPA: tRNA (adenosine(37)-N6)-threonylcarbamoyltransferase complex dimerization subunit type 1 TsaB [Haliangium sp.]|nr:tRNA (adenosine(37)-N6)-threonylcarbamoyltransferase complex dimerization subunit type 1 TsaB [Haliangium sp.]